MDIEQTLSARAAMTIGKDMTFRDFAQGAFRMRAVGAGQTISLLITPQVAHLVRTEVALMRGVNLREQKALADASGEQLLKAMCAWLVVNLMRCGPTACCRHVAAAVTTAVTVAAAAAATGRRTSRHVTAM